MEFPKEVLTTSKKGKVEARSIVDTGVFARYEYLDPHSGQQTEKKVKFVLKNTQGEIIEEFFVIPMKGSRSLLIPVQVKGKRKLWVPEQQMVVDL